jgi:hypothetical protein
MVLGELANSLFPGLSPGAWFYCAKSAISGQRSALSPEIETSAFWLGSRELWLTADG